MLGWTKRKNKLDYEFLPDTIEAIETPPSPLGTFFILLVSFIIVAAFMFSYFGKVDKVVSGTGKVIPNGDVKLIQPITMGKIKEIKVKEGQAIKKGDVIIDLESKELDIQVSKLETDITNAKIEEQILLNDKNGKYLDEGIDFNNVSESLKKYYDDYKNSKADLYQKSKSSDERNLNEIQDKYNQEKKKLDDLKNKLDNDKKNKETELQATYSQKEYDLQEKVVSDIQKNIDDQKQRIKENESKRQNSILQELIEKKKNIKNLEFQLESLKNQKTSSQIISSVDGYISTLNYNTVGIPVTPDKLVATVIPEETEMIMEAFIANRDISEITVGQEVALKFEAYSYQKYGVIKGKVDYIANNAMQDPKLGGVYKVNIKLNKQYIEFKDEKLKILPGMNAQVEIMCGKRRILDYFLDPFKDAVKNTFTK
ncbi:hemolysin D [Clostridium cavendishii DSM 21758]|uniref:Hemolysin D n=1 Tax=Clostridium cavendishii DSM 21758 TaxID=1121302 RepID=A0A1M6L130_9CLOT|nr:HlyD family efflux transporter periplasmic adaptor subunit [Clostridium cavendishii]SHJ64888.1 hemolysin D [Clostridium cavendishii DSM 21758]